MSEQYINGHGLGVRSWGILAADANTTLGRRASCGLVKPVAALRVHSSGPGLVTSCPGRREAVLRLAGGPTTARLGLRGTVCLQFPLPSGHRHPVDQ